MHYEIVGLVFREIAFFTAFSMSMDVSLYFFNSSSGAPDSAYWVRATFSVGVGMLLPKINPTADPSPPLI